MNEQATPFARFRYFWWTLGIFAVFGIAALIFNLLSGPTADINSYDDERRLGVRQDVDNEQAKLFPDFKPEDTFAIVGKELLESKPSPAPAPEAAPETDAAPAADQ